MAGSGTIQKSEQAQASAFHTLTDADVRARVWELHLRCVPKMRIGELVGLHRNTVARYVREMYREVGADRKEEQKRKLDSAVVRMRRIQEQAWNDHDADDERERAVLFGGAAKRGTHFHSQRCHYLRVILDAEKEIARLEGLYEAQRDEEGGVVELRIVREGSRP